MANNRAQIDGFRSMAELVGTTGRYRLIDHRGFVVMFGLTHASAIEFARAYCYRVVEG